MLTNREAILAGQAAVESVKAGESLGASLPGVWACIAGDVSGISLIELAASWAQFASLPKSKGADQISACVQFVGILREFEENGGRVVFVDPPRQGGA